SSYQILADLLSYQGNLTDAMAIAELGYNALSKAIEQDPDNADWQKRKYYYYYQRFKFSHALTEEDIKRHLLFLDETMQVDKSALSSTNNKEIIARHWLTASEHLQIL